MGQMCSYFVCYLCTVYTTRILCYFCPVLCSVRDKTCQKCFLSMSNNFFPRFWYFIVVLLRLSKSVPKSRFFRNTVSKRNRDFMPLCWRFWKRSSSSVLTVRWMLNSKLWLSRPLAWPRVLSRRSKPRSPAVLRPARRVRGGDALNVWMNGGEWRLWTADGGQEDRLWQTN